MYHQRLQQDPQRLKLIDATLSPDAVESLVWEQVKLLIGGQASAVQR